MLTQSCPLPGIQCFVVASAGFDAAIFAALQNCIVLTTVAWEWSLNVEGKELVKVYFRVLLSVTKKQHTVWTRLMQLIHHITEIHVSFLDLHRCTEYYEMLTTSLCFKKL